MSKEIKYHTQKEALAAVTQNGDELEFCTPKLQNDEEVVLAAIKTNSGAFQYASDTLKNNKDFILKALHEGVEPCDLIRNSNNNIQSDIEVMTLAVEKNNDGWVFLYAKGEVALNKELAAKALVKWRNRWGRDESGLWEKFNPTLTEFFQRDSWYEKAQAYLHHLEQSKNVLGGCSDEDGVVW